jgi:hypothetical protein
MAFQLPDNFDAITDVAELQALIDQGLDALRALKITPESDDETLDEGERIEALITQVSTHRATVEADAAKRAERADRLSKVAEAPKAEDKPEDKPEAKADDKVEPAKVEADPNAGGETIKPDAVTTPEGELVTAGGSPARRAAANADPDARVAPARKSVVASLVAAADVPGIPTGAPLDGLTAAAQAVLNRLKGMPTTNIARADSGVHNRYGAAMIRRGGDEGLSQASTHDDYGLVWKASNEKLLPGGSLVAAGGWCAPSETLYDLCQYETVQGILDMPEITVTRGGIRWTQGPDFADIYAACGFAGTEAQAIAGTMVKTCCEVDCPPFEEIRLDPIGLCVKTPLLTNAAYPELVRRFLEGALVAQQHKVNKYVIDTISAAAGPAITMANTGSITRGMEALNVVAIGQRNRYRMADNANIEVVLPFWVKDLIKADWGLRPYDKESSDAAVARWFSDRNLSVQWVHDFQPLADGDADCAVVIPTTVQALLYPAGTWTRGRQDVINIDAVYDAASLADNVFTALFVEEGILAVQRCTQTCKVVFETCVSGRTAAMDISGCLTFPPAVP